MSFSTLSPADSQAQAAPTDVRFYQKFGVPKSGVPANRENIRLGLRFSAHLFKAVEDEFVRRLTHEHILGTGLRDKTERCRNIVGETITTLPIPDFVGTSDPTFFRKALNKFLSLVNETRVKQSQRQIKRESTGSQDTRPAKAQRTSMTSKTSPKNLSVPLTSDPPHPRLIQLVILNDRNECVPVSLHRLIPDSSISCDYLMRTRVPNLTSPTRSTMRGPRL